jgi:hypothetical protein
MMLLDGCTLSLLDLLQCGDGGKKKISQSDLSTNSYIENCYSFFGTEKP